LLTDIPLFWRSWKETALFAWVILPDHFHCIVDCGDKNISNIMHNFKITYSRNYRDSYTPGKVWQDRFWDHIIRDQEDMNRHLDYIHYNPVKHGFVNDPFLYGHSTLIKFHKDGYYQRDWGIKETIEFGSGFGE
jgi:putative transposase